MTDSASAAGKPDAYFGTPRTDLLELVGHESARNVLEVGCGAGANASWLRQHGAERLEGVEPHDASAERAAARFDLVHRSTIEDALPQLRGPFDLIICADVLEHLVDPTAVLAQLRAEVSPSGALLVSTPNIRHVTALFRIAFGAGFRPEISGTFDSTHLRFFTRRNLRDALASSGWSAETWAYPQSTALGHVRTLLGRLTRGSTDEWLAAEWYVVARPARVA